MTATRCQQCGELTPIAQYAGMPLCGVCLPIVVDSACALVARRFPDARPLRQLERMPDLSHVYRRAGA